MEQTLCAANAANMKFYFNEAEFGILPEQIKQELKIICVLYCSDVGGIISMGFDRGKRLCITTAEPIDEIGAELKIKQIRTQHAELFEQLETFAKRRGEILRAAAETAAKQEKEKSEKTEKNEGAQGARETGRESTE